MKYKVYAGYYELFITDKELNLVLVAEFENMQDAEDYVEERGDWCWVDEDLLSESQYTFDGDDYDKHIFYADKYLAA